MSRKRTRRSAVLLLLAVWWWPASVSPAGEGDAAPGESGAPAERAGPRPWDDRAPVHLFFATGDLRADETADRLDGETSSFSVSFGGGYRFREFVSLDFEGALLYREFDTPPGAPSGAFDEVELESRAFLVGTRFIGSVKRWEPYVVAGIGFYMTEAQVRGGFIGFGIVADEDEFDVGLHYGVGFEIILGPTWNLGLDYRVHDVDSNLGNLSGGRTDIGGKALSLVLRYYF